MSSDRLNISANDLFEDTQSEGPAYSNISANTLFEDVEAAPVLDTSPAPKLSGMDRMRADAKRTLNSIMGIPTVTETGITQPGNVGAIVPYGIGIPEETPFEPMDELDDGDVQKLVAGDLGDKGLLGKLANISHKLFADEAAIKAKANIDIIAAKDLSRELGREVLPHELNPDFKTAWEIGAGHSIPGLIKKVKMGEEYADYSEDIPIDELGMGDKLTASARTLLGDLPFYAAGGMLGGTSGGPAAPLTAMGGAFAFPQGLRALYSHMLESGKIDTADEFFDALPDVVMETLKGYATGLVTAKTGQAAKGLFPGSGLLSEVGAFTSTGAALDGRLPTKEEFLQNAIVIMGLRVALGPGKAVTDARNVASNLRRVWVETGMPPGTVVESVRNGDLPAEAAIEISHKNGLSEKLKKEVEAKVKEAEERDAELVAKWTATKKARPEDAVKTEQAIKGEKVKKVKRQAVTKLPKVEEPQEPPHRREKPKPKGRPKSPYTIEKNADGEWDLKYNDELVDTFVTKKAAEEQKKAGLKPEPVVEEDIDTMLQKAKDVDEQIFEKPPELTGDAHPLRETDIDHTTGMRKIVDSIPKDPETFSRYLINEVNHYLNGGEVDIRQVMDSLNRLAAETENARDSFAKQADFDHWADTVKEASEWAGEAVRLKSKRSGGGEQLNIMIPVNEVPKHVRELLKFWRDELKIFTDNELKDVLFRNEEIFGATGFWLGRDGRWRYEISDHDVHFTREFQDNVRIHPDAEAVGMRAEAAIHAPKLFEAVPEMKDVMIEIKPELGSGGHWDAFNNTIRISGMQRHSSLMHELQHAVAEKTGTLFKGTNPTDAKASAELSLLGKLKDIATNKDVIELIKQAERDLFLRQDTDKAVSNIISEAWHFASRGEESVDVVHNAMDLLKVKGLEEYYKSPGEMEARLAAARMDMEAWQRKEVPPWETLDRLLKAESESTGVGPEAGTKLYSGIYPDIPILQRRLGKFAKDKFKFKGNKFSFGVVDLRDGEIEQTISYAKAEEVDFHHSFWVRDELLEKIENDEAAVFWFHGKTPVTMESRLKDRNIEKRIIEQVPGSKSAPAHILYTGLDVSKVGDELIKGARKVSSYMDQARGVKKLKPVEATSRARDEAVRSFVDRSGNLRRNLLAEHGDEGYRILQRMYLAKGATARATSMLKQMGREVYKGLSRKERAILDNLIFADRMVDISQYKSTKQFKFPKGTKPTDYVAYKHLFQYIHKLSDAQAAKIANRAEKYFEWMKKPLADMLEAELISQGEYDALVAHNYRRLKLVDIYDKRYKRQVGGSKRTIYDSGIEPLARGRDTNIFEPSSEVMALEVFNRAYGRIMNNYANLEMLRLARENPENPFVRVKESKRDKIPSGWQRHYVYEGAKRKPMYLSPEASREWITNSPELSYKAAQTMRWLSGSPLLRMMATGVNWGFALANLPRDIMHAWFTVREFKDGKWRMVYNPNLPIFAGQMTRDQAAIFNDALLRKGRFNDYINEGGGMEFMTTSGRLFQRGKHVRGTLDPLFDFFGYFGETTEVMTRLAIRERMIRRRAREKGISMEEARRDKDITQEATFAARDYMDFGQGGGLAKAADNALPYLNASIQGTRGIFRSMRPSGNPVSTAYKMTQFAGLVSAIYIGGMARSPKTMEALEDDINMDNNLVISLGDNFSFVDQFGQTRYIYLKVPLDPGQKWLKAVTEGAVQKWLYEDEFDVGRVVEQVEHLSPAGISSYPPSAAAVLGYVQNRDFWMNEDIWKKTKEPLPWPMSEEEYIPGRTPEFFEDIGSVTKLSPERTKYAVEQLVTRGTLWSMLMGAGYEELFGDMPDSMREKHIAEVIAKIPVAKRFIGVTNPYSRFAEGADEAIAKDSLNRFVENRGLDTLVNGYLYEGNATAKQIGEYINRDPETGKARDPKVRKRLFERYKFSMKIKDVPYRSVWLTMQGIPSAEARAEYYAKEYDKLLPESQKEMQKAMIQVKAAGGVISSEFMKALVQLRSQELE